MGSFKKVFGGVGKTLSKGLGAITGTNAAKKAAEQQAQQLRAQQLQEAQLAAASAADTAIQAQTKQSTLESKAALDRATDEAAEQQRKAAEENNAAVTVDLGSSGTETDADGARINVRDTFMSDNVGNNTRRGAGLRI